MTSAPEIDTIRAELRDAYAAFARALAERDAGSLAAHYDDDAVILAPGGVPVAGAAAVQAYWEGLCAMPYRFEVAGFTVEHILAEGPYVVEISRFRGTAHDLERGGSYTYDAKNLVVWRKRAGRWLIVRDMYNDMRGSAPAGDGVMP